MVTVTTRPQTYQITETPALAISDWKAGMIQVAYRDTGTMRRWRLTWPEATWGQWKTYEYIFRDDVSGPLGAFFDWSPPNDSATIRARRITPLRMQAVTPQAVRLEVEFEARWVPEFVIPMAPFPPLWAPFLWPF